MYRFIQPNAGDDFVTLLVVDGKIFYLLETKKHDDDGSITSNIGDLPSPNFKTMNDDKRFAQLLSADNLSTVSYVGMYTFYILNLPSCRQILHPTEPRLTHANLKP
jgi:hypothetical protein